MFADYADLIETLKGKITYYVSNEYNTIINSIMHICNESWDKPENYRFDTPTKGEFMNMLTWSSVVGKHMRRDHFGCDYDTMEPVNMLKDINHRKRDNIWVLYNFHRYMNDEEIIKQLKISWSKEMTIVIISPILNISKELENAINVIDKISFGKKEYENLVKGLVGLNKRNIRDKAVDVDAVVESLEGLTLMQSENLLTLCLIAKKGYDIDYIKEYKENILNGFKVELA